MTYSKRMGVLLAGALAAAACGGGSSISIDALPGALESALCGRYVRCGAYVSAAACKDDVNANIAQLQASIAAGRVAYDGNLVADCLDAEGAASCDTTVENARVTPAACDQAIKGTVADAGTCFTSQECVSGRCTTASCGMACCSGTCAATVADAAIGGSCATASCVAGAFCNPSKVCTALLAANAACQSNDECGYGLTCAGNVCKAAANRGEACPDGSCDDLGDRCDGTSMTCIALSGVGGACSAGFAGLFDCQRPLVCNATSLTCENPPTVGQTCQFSCAHGSFCNNTSHTCEAPRANAATCAGNVQCTSGYCNDHVTPHVCADEPVCR